MERTLCLIILGLALLGLSSISAKAQEMGSFDEFETDAKYKVDIVVDSLDFIRPESGKGRAGTFQFQKFHFNSANSSIFLENNNNIFDSTVYIKDKFIGIKGPNTRFSYNLAQVDAEYLHTFYWAKIKSTRLLMDDEQIKLSGEYYQIRKPKTILKLENFTWDCDRHPDYMENNSKGFLAGCLNMASILPINDSNAIDVSYKFIEENKSDEGIQFDSSITEILMNKTNFKGHTNESELRFDNGVKLISSDMVVECEKQEDLIDITSKSVLTPCLSNFNMTSNLFAILDRGETHRDYKFIKPKISLLKDKILIETEELHFESEEINFDLIKGTLITKKKPGFDIIKFDDYLVSWYNSSELLPSSGSSSIAVSMDFSSIDEKSNEKSIVKLSSNLNHMKIINNKILIDSNKFVIDLDNEYLFKFNSLKVDCFKKVISESFVTEQVLKDCKGNGRFVFPKLVIDNKKDPKKSKYYLKSEYLKVENGFLSILAPGFQLVDKETNITLLNSSVKCKKSYEKDLFDVLDVIEDCFENSKAYIEKIVSEKNKKRKATKEIYSLYEKILNGEDHNPISLVKTKDAFVRDIRLSIVKNWLKIELEIKFLGANLKVRAEGEIELDRDNGIIIIDIQKAKLPLTKSKKILMYFLKKNLASEKIYFEDGLIKIML